MMAAEAHYMFFTEIQSPASTTLPLTGWPAWQQAWTFKTFRLQLSLALLIGLALAFGLPYYFAIIEARAGYVLPDLLLAHLPARDVSWQTFAVIYLSILVAVVHLLRHPLAFLRVLWAYCIMHIIRIGTLWLAPFDPPAGFVLLHDPIVDTFFYPDTDPITKDLFFSGHTATIMLLALAVQSRRLRRVLLMATVAVGFLVLVQHAHYTYDVLAAPLFAALSFWLAGKLSRKASRL